MKRLATGFLLIALLAPGVAAQTGDPAPRRAASMRLQGDWRLDGRLPTNAMLISLQGVANREAPNLYFVYPPDWVFSFTEAIYDYYGTRHRITFDELATPEEALERFASTASGYVVWDDSVRTSLTVAFTVAGIENAIVVNEALIPLAEAHGLREVDDLRGRYRGQTDAQIYRDAWTRYKDRVTHDFVVWMGGVTGPLMEPGVADYGIYQRAFFTDLSADPRAAEEYALADEILGAMSERGVVLGWHSYAKDTEGQMTTLVSQHALRMEGLNTLPNTSFNTQVPVTPGFRYRNQHNVRPGQVIVPEAKVYVAAVQTDAIGIGAWLKPGRGSIPYAWEVTMNWTWMSPAIMQFHYEQATPNDYFTAAPSGPGYMYAKPIPDADRPRLLAEARALADTLDIRVVGLMDYSEGTRTMGNLDITREVMDDYYEAYPDALGFINGYGAAGTFDVRDGVPTMSFDYYLGETRPQAEAVADLQELVRMNAQRPAFLLLHIRQWSTIAQVKAILDQVGPDVQIVPLDVFLTMAANGPRPIQTRYASPDRPLTGPAHAPGSRGARLDAAGGRR